MCRLDASTHVDMHLIEKTLVIFANIGFSLMLHGAMKLLEILKLKTTFQALSRAVRISPPLNRSFFTHISHYPPPSRPSSSKALLSCILLPQTHSDPLSVTLPTRKSYFCSSTVVPDSSNPLATASLPDRLQHIHVCGLLHTSIRLALLLLLLLLFFTPLCTSRVLGLRIPFPPFLLH